MASGRGAYFTRLAKSAIRRSRNPSCSGPSPSEEGYSFLGVFEALRSDAELRLITESAKLTEGLARKIFARFIDAQVEASGAAANAKSPKSVESSTHYGNTNQRQP